MFKADEPVALLQTIEETRDEHQALIHHARRLFSLLPGREEHQNFRTSEQIWMRVLRSDQPLQELCRKISFVPFCLVLHLHIWRFCSMTDWYDFLYLYQRNDFLNNVSWRFSYRSGLITQDIIVGSRCLNDSVLISSTCPISKAAGLVGGWKTQKPDLFRFVGWGHKAVKKLLHQKFYC